MKEKVGHTISKIESFAIQCDRDIDQKISSIKFGENSPFLNSKNCQNQVNKMAVCLYIPNVNKLFDKHWKNRLEIFCFEYIKKF